MISTISFKGGLPLPLYYDFPETRFSPINWNALASSETYTKSYNCEQEESRQG
jgi:hypothetical protein